MSSSQAVTQDQPFHQDVQPHTQAHQSTLPGLLPQKEQLQVPEQPAGWTDVMTGWVQYLLRTGTELNAIEAGMRSFFPSINNMIGVQQHLEKLKMEWEGQEVPMQQD